ncbi:hypothetical protein BX070DRAFT_24571 [Coemansia spiralis]|nr:hypothetical protein BX070DRAFT_24571 [Coemansia spiralis]
MFDANTRREAEAYNVSSAVRGFCLHNGVGSKKDLVFRYPTIFFSIVHSTDAARHGTACCFCKGEHTLLHMATAPRTAAAATVAVAVSARPSKPRYKRINKAVQRAYDARSTILAAASASNGACFAERVAVSALYAGLQRSLGLELSALNLSALFLEQLAQVGEGFVRDDVNIAVLAHLHAVRLAPRFDRRKLFYTAAGQRVGRVELVMFLDVCCGSHGFGDTRESKKIKEAKDRPA